MSKRREGKNPAAQPTISGQAPEDIQIFESDTSPIVEDQIMEIATKRVSFNMGRTNNLGKTQRDENKVFDRGKDSTVFEDNFEIFGGFAGCDSGDRLQDSRPTAVGEREVGSMFRDGTVGVPATKHNGIPSYTPEFSKKKKKKTIISAQADLGF